MNATLVDAAGILRATAIMAPMVLLPGATIAAAAQGLRRRRPDRSPDAILAVLLGLAVLPALLSLLVRFAGLNAAIGLQCLLAVLGLLPGVRPAKLPLAWGVPLLVWVAVAVLSLVDFDSGGGLYHSALVRDLTKHTAAANSIITWGLPPIDPFFLRPMPGAYYYFAHTLCILPVWVTGGLIDARATVGALIILCGVGLFALSLFAWQRCRFASIDPGRIALLLLVLLLARNLDILPAIALIAAGEWPIDIERWNEQILGWLFSCLWVPQHVISLIAGLVGLFVLADDDEIRTRFGRLQPIVAGIAFATCVGASVWVGLGIVVTCALWLASLWHRRRRGVAISLMIAGGIAAVLLVPLCLEIIRGRADEGIPIEFAIRGFLPVDRAVPPGLLRDLGDLVLLPLNYFVALGLFCVGAVVFWRQNGWRHPSEAARVLTFCALSGLVLGSFTRSAIINNDLGWRVMLLTQFSALIWTAAVIVRTAEAQGTGILALARWPARLGLLALVGYAGNLYNLVSIRAFPLMGPNLALFDPLFDRPDLDRALRQAYSWLNLHLPIDAVVQHNPVSGSHIYNYGLYSRNRVAVGDAEAMLYGASKTAVDARLEAIGRLFTLPLSAAAVRAEGTAQGIGVLLVSNADPIWSVGSSWVWSTQPIYADTVVRLLAVAEIGEKKEK